MQKEKAYFILELNILKILPAVICKPDLKVTIAIPGSPKPSEPLEAQTMDKLYSWSCWILLYWTTFNVYLPPHKPTYVRLDAARGLLNCTETSVSALHRRVSFVSLIVQKLL